MTTHGNNLLILSGNPNCGLILQLDTIKSHFSGNENLTHVEYFLHYFDEEKFQLCAFCAQILAQMKPKPKKMKTSHNFRSLHTYLFLSENHF